MTSVVIVESPAKAKTINKYLGPGYTVVASFGHVRDLPSKEGSVQPEQDFAMLWEVEPRAMARINDIAKAVKGADALYLATDPDREGEAISWHVLELLNQKKALDGVAVKRVAFNEITKSAIEKAMAEPRELDRELIDAYLARRALDYLVGFTLSPVLWRKLPGARSAGRVQSVALRLIVDRELEIEKFIPQEYWSIAGAFQTEAGEAFSARLYALAGEKVQKLDIGNEAKAREIQALAKGGSYRIAAVEKKPQTRNPWPPFTTSTLQQEAARKLGFSARRTMQIAQGLYEGKPIDGEVTGLITYMRTDGVQISNEAITSARRTIAGTFGNIYLPSSPRLYQSKIKNAQEAHEAIRPTDPARAPESVARSLDHDELRLYELIWKRTLASQMASAKMELTTATIEAEDSRATFRAAGTVMQFDGFLRLYREDQDEQTENGDEAKLPALKDGERPSLNGVEAKQHFTEPLPRYSEASLVKKLEELGIGRPSTYASILSVLRDRSYVRMDRNRFIPEDKGIVVTAFLESFFDRYVEYDFTAELEEELDKISAGLLDWKEVLRTFWKDFSARTTDVLGVRTSVVLDKLNDHLEAHIFPPPKEGGDGRKCPKCETGRLSLKVGRFGVFIGCSNYPDCRFTRPLAASEAHPAAPAHGKEVLGQDPATGQDVKFKTGRFGPYLELGEAKSKDEKPKRAPVPKDLPPGGLTLEKALALLALPRTVGAHPETGKPIVAGIGRFGPYVAHDGKYASLPTSEDVFTIGVNHAVTLIAESKSRGPRRGPAALKDLGAHPADGKKVKVMEGRYGPYVNHGKTNATIPGGIEPTEITMAQAVELLAARAARQSAKKGGARKKGAKKPKTP
jgi:DNA topoisomerase I